MTLAIPSTIISDLSTAVSGTFESLGVLIALMVSIPLAFYILRRVLSLFPKPRSRPH